MKACILRRNKRMSAYCGGINERGENREIDFHVVFISNK